MALEAIGEPEMPLDEDVKTVFSDALSKLDGICANIKKVMLQNGVEPTTIDNNKRIDILQKVYQEVINYDRHYSITRSAITSLLITVGLAAAKDGFDHLPTVATLGLSCDLRGFLNLSIELLRTFFVTMILFFFSDRYEPPFPAANVLMQANRAQNRNPYSRNGGRGPRHGPASKSFCDHRN
jgi:hypothetical protein